jgi:TIR domain
MRHDAFLSYSHADESLARELERGLEKLAKPLLKLRALDIFRDETSLAASPGLWPSIVEHLSASEWFLLLCSRQAAASPWCHKEAEWWLENRSMDRMLLLLTEGEIVWDTQAHDFDFKKTTASGADATRFPLSLGAKYREAGRFSSGRCA